MGNGRFFDQELEIHMKIAEKSPPRMFQPLPGSDLTISDCGTVALEPDELVTFVTDGGSAYDVARKSWGYYATPSLNGRLPKNGLRPAMMRNASGLIFLVLVEHGKEEDFAVYLRDFKQELVGWCDDTAFVSHITQFRAE